MTRTLFRVTAGLIALGMTSAAGCGLGGAGSKSSSAPATRSSRASVTPSASSQASWTRIGVTDSGLNLAGLYRTSDGNLHVVWLQKDAAGKSSYQWATISAVGQPTGSGAVLSGWETLEGDPQLLPDRNGLRLVFLGGQDTNRLNFFSVGAVYTAASPDGASWKLVHGSLAAHTVLNDGLSAASVTGTPTVVFGLNNVLYLHTGIDLHAPAAKPDRVAATGPVATGIAGATLTSDGSGGLWLAWSDQGYWVRKLLPAAGQPIKIPGSGSGTPDNSPNGKVAMAATASSAGSIVGSSATGMGIYVAYCAPSATAPCSVINLWRVGAAAAMPVPGSGTGSASRVAIAAAPGGRVWVVWFDGNANVIRAAETDTTGSAFGPVRTIPLPPATAVLSHVQAEASAGPLDVIANITSSTAGNPSEFWLAQVPAG